MQQVVDPLYSFLFAPSQTTEHVYQEEDLSHLSNDQLFVNDSKVPVQENKKVWHDADDDLSIDLLKTAKTKKLKKNPEETEISGSEYQQRLSSHHQRIFQQTPQWAQINNEKQQNSLFGNFSIENHKSRQLKNHHLEIQRLRDANYQSQHTSIVTGLDWHPNGDILMTSGLDNRVILFQVNGKENHKLSSYHLNQFPITSAHFLRNGSEVVATANNRKYYYLIDLESERLDRVHALKNTDYDGSKCFVSKDYLAFLHGQHILLCCAKTKQLVHQFSINANVTALTFSEQNQEMAACGDDGEIYIFDLKQEKCLHRFQDEGALQNLSISYSNNSKYLAIGNTSGIVNLYKTSTAMKSYLPKPKYTFTNLTTGIDSVAFHPDDQLMAMASRQKKDQMRMIHLESGKVFSNWPTSGTPLGYIQKLAFNPKGEYFTIGNAKGKVLLYSLGHYRSQ